MKILLSAYACEPGRGSEPGVGWQWAVQLAKRGHEIWVLTRENSKPAIDAELQNVSETERLHFVYYDLPRWSRSWKKGERGVHLYYLLWQIGIVSVARQLHKKVGFDLVHHITFGVFRQPSFLWRLNIPFIFGPLGGGDRAPFALRRSFGWQGWFRDLLRDAVNLLACFTPALHRTFSSADLIVVKTAQTLDFVPQFARHKSLIALEIGIDFSEIQLSPLSPLNRDATFQILYVGRFVYLKGGHLAIRAFAEFARTHPNASFTLVGKGEEQTRWSALAAELGVASKVRFIEWMPRWQLAQYYQSHQVFLFPSLRDASGNVVLEALNYALPVVCLKLGGPSVLVDESCGRVIDVTGLNELRVVEQLAVALQEMAGSAELLAQLRTGALARAREYSWERVVSRVYDRIEMELKASKQT